jgi:large repetitive protein
VSGPQKDVMRQVRVLVLVVLLAAVVVPAALALRFTDRSYAVPSGVSGMPYRHWFTGDGGCGPTLPYQFRVVNGALPPGLTVHRDGLLTGTPTLAGSWSFWVELSDQDPPSAPWCAPKKSEREFTVRVGAPPTTVGTPYALGLGAAGEGPKTWTIAAGQLPPGLTLNPAGVITGTPTAEGSTALRLAVFDSQGRTIALDLTIAVRPKLIIATPRLVPARVGRVYRASVKTRGGAGPVKLEVRSGRFPVGVQLDLRTGKLSGKPHKAGAYRITIEASDSFGASTARTLVLSVRSLTGQKAG